MTLNIYLKNGKVTTYSDFTDYDWRRHESGDLFVVLKGDRWIVAVPRENMWYFDVK